MVRSRPGLRLRAVLVAVTASALFVVLPVAAQERPRAGTSEAALLLRQLDGVKRVLMIGAHPDDENSALLATLARGMGAETAYLSLTRGEGGQNLIGPELMESLGIVRTGELIAARRLDGGTQFFTRAIDYGFSKSADEAFSHWPREELLRDVVWVIRTFRPHLIISVFSGTPADGHGHHQAAGILAAEGFRAAADPGAYPDQLEYTEPWQAAKLFRNVRRVPGGVPSIVIETGTFDPVLARSWYQLAMEGRSQHRSQDMGAAQTPGPRTTQLVLVDAVREIPSAAPLFAGVDTTLVGAAAGLPGSVRNRATRTIDEYRAAIREAGDSLSVTDPGRAVPPLARALSALDELWRMTVSSPPEGLVAAGHASDLAWAVTHHRKVAERALLAAAGIVVEARTEDSLLVPGEGTTVEVTVWNGGRYDLEDVAARLLVPARWETELVQGTSRVAGAGPAGRTTISAGELASWSFRVRVPTDVTVTEPYFLRQERQGDLYRWPDDPSAWGLPAEPPPIHADVVLGMKVKERTEPTRANVIQEAPYVGVAQASGEFREPVLVVPSVSVSIDHTTMAWPISDLSPREIAVRLSGQAEGGVRGTVRIEAPTGWAVEPASRPFEVSRSGAVTSVVFRVVPPPGETGAPGSSERVVLRAVAESPEGERWDRSVRLIDYPHIRRGVYLTPAELTIVQLDVHIPSVRVGYVMGSGDSGYEVLTQLGADAELLTPQRVTAADFTDFDVIAIGARAYETRPDLVAANDRILDFARAGGTVVVQYQQYQYASGDYAPYPISINRPHDRVTDEHAEVRILDSSAAVLTTPNVIGPADWEGWVHERGLYFLGQWDARYTPVLEMADAGEPPLAGSLLVAPVGEGIFVYTGLAFFRQFPAGVSGAYRLFANLIALGR